ncbi:MAG: hypothetical protein ACOX86_03790 [Pelotomaculaceae bacterium]|uniref:Uncharacterized protein n=1 Tax=anaerobic digester metagenome TaxID=1263854 RepID=A0A485LUY7_9ZZZZ|nr:hypothetical protein [Bacillota bacterium]HHU86125.1 hypothetical protein [Peptococcaceae bacterium]
MKIEQTMETFCRIINRKTRVNIRVHLAERLCGYDLVQLSHCLEQENCPAGQHCEFIKQEEEKAVDQLIQDYYEQLKLRDEIRERLKDSNQ